MQQRWAYGGRSLFVLLSAVPIVAGVSYALLYSLGLTGVMAEGFTLAHWQEILGDAAFWRTLGFSLYVAAVSILTALGFSLALVLRSPQAFTRGRLSFFIYLPLSIPAIVMAFFIFQLLGKGGWLSRVSHQLGLISALEQFPDWVNDNYGIGIIVAHVIMATPFFTIFFANLYQNERLGEYLHLAATLGAKGRQRVFRTIQRLQRYNLGDIPEAYAISVAYTVLVVALLGGLLWYNRKQMGRA